MNAYNVHNWQAHWTAVRIRYIRRYGEAAWVERYPLPMMWA